MAQELKAFEVGLGQYCKDGSPCVVAFATGRTPRVLNKKIYLKSEVDTVLAEKDAEIRRLKRALWLARAERAESQWNRLLRDSGICFAVGKNKEWDLFNQKQKKWQNVERKCRAKAEEYK